MSLDQTTTASGQPVGEDSFAPFGCPMGHGGSRQGSESGVEGGSRRRSRRGYFLPGLIALVVMVAAGGAVNFAGLDHQSPGHLAGPDVALFVAQGIEAEDSLSALPSIACPASEPVRAGLSFDCRWLSSAGDRLVTVTQTDGRGQFRFSVAPAD